MIKDILTVVLLIAQLVKDLPQHKEHMMWIKRIALAKRRMDKQQKAASRRLKKLMTEGPVPGDRYYADYFKGNHVIGITLRSIDNEYKKVSGTRYHLSVIIDNLLYDVAIEVLRYSLLSLVSQTSYGVDPLDGTIIKKVDEAAMKRLVYILSHERQLSKFFNHSRDFIQAVIAWRCLRAYFSHWITYSNGVDQGYDQQLREWSKDDALDVVTYRYKITDLGSSNPFMNTRTIYLTIEYPNITRIISSGKPQWRYVLNWYRDYKRFKITFG